MLNVRNHEWGHPGAFIFPKNLAKRVTPKITFDFKIKLNQVQKREGALSKLLVDDQLFEDSKRLIHNWRVYGLFYQGKSDKQYPTSSKERMSTSLK